MVCLECMATVDPGTEQQKYRARAAWNRRSPDIVRCGECESYGIGPFGYRECFVHYNGKTEHIPHNPDDFCSHGIRRKESK